MVSLDYLKQEVISKLQNYPSIERFFKEQIVNRMKNELWLESHLIQIILLDIKDNIDNLTRSLNQIENDTYNYDILKNKRLNGSEKDWDFQVGDLLAELNAYLYLKRVGFNDIKVIPQSAGKTPDFSAVKDEVKYLFEVKNMRSPFTWSDYFFDKWHAKLIQYPDIYKSVQFDINLVGEDEDFSDTDKCAFMNLLEKIEYELRNGTVDKEEKQVCFSYEKVVNGKYIKKQIECGIGVGNVLIACSGKAEFINTLLPPFLKKTWRKVQEGSEQLIQYDNLNEYRKAVLIYWEVPSKYAPFKNECRKEAMELTNHTLKLIGQHISVELL